MPQVTLRKKAITKDRHSFYLDFYPAILNPETGKPTRREFLNLYIFDKPKTEQHKTHNKATLALAENIQAKRQLSLQAENYGFLKKSQQDVDFISYFESLAGKQSKKNKATWLVVNKYLIEFSGGNMRSSMVNKNFCNEFKDFLLTTKSRRSEKQKLSQNAAHSYFKNFRISLKKGFEDGILKDDLYNVIKPIAPAETHREFLSKEELQLLANTECDMPVLKKAALFSGLTGLRFSDIAKMIWSEIRYNDNDGYYIKFYQQKTGGAEILPISEKAHTILGKRAADGDLIFKELKYSAYTNLHLKAWLFKAGIKRKITFHSFRHTFATLQISLGTDIYTVSKMLGHRDLETTQVYAKIVDQKKREAANKIDIEI